MRSISVAAANGPTVSTAAAGACAAAIVITADAVLILMTFDAGCARVTVRVNFSESPTANRPEESVMDGSRDDSALTNRSSDEQAAAAT